MMAPRSGRPHRSTRSAPGHPPGGGAEQAGHHHVRRGEITRGKDSIWNHLVPDGEGGYKLTPSARTSTDA